MLLLSRFRNRKNPLPILDGLGALCDFELTSLSGRYS